MDIFTSRFTNEVIHSFEELVDLLNSWEFADFNGDIVTYYTFLNDNIYYPFEGGLKNLIINGYYVCESGLCENTLGGLIVAGATKLYMNHIVDPNGEINFHGIDSVSDGYKKLRDVLEAIKEDCDDDILYTYLDISDKNKWIF